MNEHYLRTELVRHNSLAALLAERFPDADDETLRDTLDGLTHLSEQVAALVRSALDDEGFVAALKLRIVGMRERLARLETRADKKRTLAAEIMAAAGLKRLEAPDLTLSLRAGVPSLAVTDEAAIPALYFKPQAPKLDRSLLLLALKGGEVVTGAALAPASASIAVRTK